MAMKVHCLPTKKINFMLKDNSILYMAVNCIDTS